MTHSKNMWADIEGNYSKLQGDLTFAFDKRESKVNLHKVTYSSKLPCSVKPVTYNIHKPKPTFTCLRLIPNSEVSEGFLFHIAKLF